MSTRLTSFGLLALGLLVANGPQQAVAATMPPSVSQGCFSSAGSLTKQGSYQYQSIGYCQQQCYNQGASVFGLTQGSDCYCGNSIPASSFKVNDYDCSTPCNGYGEQSCGGSDSFGIALTGTSNNVQQDQGSSSQSPSQAPSSSTPAPSSMSQSSVVTTIAPSPEIITVGGSTIISTVPGNVATSPAAAQSSSTPTHTSSGMSTGSKVGIAVGVIVGLIALAAIIAGIVIYLKRRNGGTARVGAKHSRNTGSVSNFVSAGAAPGGTTGSFNDSRLDPTMVETRRNSDGSIFADDRDYSRRILKVTNPSRDSRVG